jgi:hypothetical protein
MDDTTAFQPVTSSTSIDALDATHTGVWCVHTQGSVHEFDLDTYTYRRYPGAASNRFDHDGQPVALTRVERWPVVGGTFFIWFDDPAIPTLLEHWRQSSTIVRIERVCIERGHADA